MRWQKGKRGKYFFIFRHQHGGVSTPTRIVNQVNFCNQEISWPRGNREVGALYLDVAIYEVLLLQFV